MPKVPEVPNRSGFGVAIRIAKRTEPHPDIRPVKDPSVGSGWGIRGPLPDHNGKRPVELHSAILAANRQMTGQALRPVTGERRYARP